MFGNGASSINAFNPTLRFLSRVHILLIFISKQRSSICTKREKSRIKSFSPKSRFSVTGEMATNLRKRRASCGLVVLQPAVCRLSPAHPSPPPHCSLKWGKVKNNWWKWCAQAEWWVGDITGNKTVIFKDILSYIWVSCIIHMVVWYQLSGGIKLKHLSLANDRHVGLVPIKEFN